MVFYLIQEDFYFVLMNGSILSILKPISDCSLDFCTDNDHMISEETSLAKYTHGRIHKAHIPEAKKKKRNIP